MPEKKVTKKISDHQKRRMKRKNPVDGYEYVMSKEQYDFLLSKDGGRIKDVEGIIEYLNATGTYMKPIVKIKIA